ncbi:MAG TPA: hypothetical protein VGM19_10510 [Armatimonadota bacterium]|jgi:hypothetical protein
MRQPQRFVSAGAAALALILLLAASAGAADPPLVRVVQVTAPPAQVAEMVRGGLLALTGCPTVAEAWRTMVLPTDVVGLKVDCDPAGAITHKDLALAVARSLEEAGVPADHIIIWDRSAAQMEKAGWTLADQEGKLRVVAAETGGYDDQSAVTLPGSGDAPVTFRFPKLLTQRLTRLVALPALNCGAPLGLGMAVRSLTTGVVDNAAAVSAASSLALIPALFAQPGLQKRLTLTLADVLAPRYEDPAGQPAPWPANSLLLARNAISADAIALALVDEKRQATGLCALAQTDAPPTYLTELGKRRLGVNDLSQIALCKVGL